MALSKFDKKFLVFVKQTFKPVNTILLINYWIKDCVQNKWVLGIPT